MSALLDALVASASGDVARGLIDAAVKGTVIMGTAALAGWGLRRASAEARHLVWAFALAGLVALPALSRVLPDWRIPLPALGPIAAMAPNAAGPAGVPPAGEAVIGLPPSGGAPEGGVSGPRRGAVSPTIAISPTTGHRTVTPPSTAPSRAIPMSVWLFAAWLAGVVVVMASIAVGFFRLWRFERGARPVTDPAVQRLTDVLSRHLGITRRIRLLEREGPAMPMTWGVVRPRILVPVGFGTWPLERRRDVLVHELAHVRRFDCLTQLMARITCAVYWFHPLVWVAAAQLRLERERACDDQVLSLGGRASDYANHLLEIARSLHAGGATSVVSIAMARPSQLSGRLLAVLDARRPRRATRGVAVAAFVAAAGIVLPVAALQPQAEQRGEKREPRSETRERTIEREASSARTASQTGSAPVVGSPGRAATTPRRGLAPLYAVGEAASTFIGDVASTIAGAAEAGLVVAATTLECRWSEPNSSQSTSHHSDDDHTTIRWRSGNCTLYLTAEGEFEFTDNESEIKSLSPGGRFEITERDGNTERHLTVTADRSGRMTMVWKVNGDERPFDDEARAWLAATIPEVFRRTGIDAKGRVARILRQGGAQAVLTEIDRLRSDYVRRLYYTELLSSQRLDAATLERVVKQAGASISSDYELAELLIGIGQDYPLDGATRAGYIQASGTIQSDYERRRVLGAVLESGDLSPDALKDFIVSAGAIRSDYELGELLIAVGRRYVVSEELRRPFFEAANTLQSDYEHRRVLNSIVGKGPLAPGVLDAVLASATTINSDYEAAELLVGVAGDNSISDASAPAYLAVVSTLSSDYERRRALSAVLKGKTASRVMIQGVLEAAGSVKSHYERAELLLDVLRAGPLDAPLRQLFLSVAEGIGSTYDRDRVLAALVRRNGI